jgi:uncharacterized protein YgfB (UPF0149 family)
MPTEIPSSLPDYQRIMQNIAVLNLPFSLSEIHGIICAYLCTSTVEEAVKYVSILTASAQEKTASRELFSLLNISHMQMYNFDFQFQLLLPNDDSSLSERARAFSQWCTGFSHGITLTKFVVTDTEEKEAREAIAHIAEFAKLDYESLTIDEEDENALFEVSEYTRLIVLHLYNYNNPKQTVTRSH